MILVKENERPEAELHSRITLRVWEPNVLVQKCRPIGLLRQQVHLPLLHPIDVILNATQHGPKTVS